MLKALRDERRRNRKKCDGAEAAERAKTENNMRREMRVGKKKKEKK